MDIDRQVEIMEKQIHSKDAKFSTWEKMQYLNDYFKNDPDFHQEAIDIVISNICKKAPGFGDERKK